MVAQQLQQEWEILVNHYTGTMTATWVSNNLLRPFLFFVSCFTAENQKVHSKKINSMRTCFTILLESLNTSGLSPSFRCSFIGFHVHIPITSYT